MVTSYNKCRRYQIDENFCIKAVEEAARQLLGSVITIIIVQTPKKTDKYDLTIQRHSGSAKDTDED